MMMMNTRVPDGIKRSSQSDPRQTMNILQWNAGGFSHAKKAELHMNLNKFEIDVFTIMEANLTSEQLIYYQLTGYTLYLLPKHRQIASGILVGVRNNLTAEFKILKEMGNSTDRCEIAKVTVWKNQDNFKIYAVYSPPNNHPDFSSLNITSRTILLGDFNAHSTLWGYKDTNAAGKEIQEILNSTTLELVYYPTDPSTYLHYNGTKTTPDLLLVTTDLRDDTTCLVKDDPGSGHRPVLVKIFLSSGKIPRRTVSNSKISWNFKRANWSSFSKTLEGTLQEDKFDFTKHPDIIGKEINNAIITCAKQHIPRGKVQVYKCFWSEDLEKIKKERDDLRKEAEHTGKVEDVQAWRKQSAIFKQVVLEAKRTAFHKFITKINYQKDSLKTYKYLEKLQNKRASARKEPLDYNNKKLCSDRDIARAFAHSYAKAQKKGIYARKMSKIFKKEVRMLDENQNHTQNAPLSPTDAPINMHELQAAIQQLKTKKSPGSDGIHAEFLKHLGRKAKQTILKWFQSIWERGTVPSLWKKATIMPILKKGKNPNNVQSYRPISLTSIMGKVMERIINNRLTWILESNNIISNEQAGFRLHRSTNQQVVKLSQAIKDALDKRKIVTAVFVDFKSAYDSVWKENLILKLTKIGIKSKMLQWIQSFLKERSCRVRYGNANSNYHILQTGLPQGAVTSCTLFNIYINDLVTELKTISGLNCLLYADDIVFWTETNKKKAERNTEQTINTALVKLEKWCDKNNMTVNVSKTAYQSFSLAHQTIHPNLKYKNEQLVQTNEYKYLGVIFDKKLSWKPHIKYTSSRASKRLTMLKRLAGSKWGCAQSTLRATYQKYILPAITYCCETLVTASQDNITKLEQIQNQAMRLITGAVKTTPIDAMMSVTRNKPIQKIIEEKTLLLYEKLIRIPEDNYWTTYPTTTRNLKTQQGFLQIAQKLHLELEINSKPQPLEPPLNPLELYPILVHIDLQESIVKKDIDTETLKLLALETMHTKYPTDTWLHIFTDGSQIKTCVNAGAGVYCDLFTFYKPVGQHATAFDGEVEAIRTALSQLCLYLARFEKAVIFSDSKAALQSIGSTLNPVSAEIRECRRHIQHLSAINKTIVLQWIPGHCQIYGNEKADALAKKGTNILQTNISDLSYHSIKRSIKTMLRDSWNQELKDRTSAKPWHQHIQNIPDWPRKTSVATFRLAVGHDCLGKHLHRIGISDVQFCVLCHQNEDMDRDHLQRCTALTSVTECDRYWEARGKMG